ncbi:MAG: ATP-binding cassette domain-containing protein, partial [Candidatus Devosia euplotis]|nr:ATP-binding cassette domain-containing protein [Candidatus Devosia euplotis]
MASWGTLTSDAVETMRAYPHQLFFSAAAISLTMFALNFLGDDLRAPLIHGLANDRPLVLSVRDLKASFFSSRGAVQAVRGVSFDVYPGEILGIVGESGSDKSITCMSVLRLLKASGRIMGGEALFDGRDLLALDEADLRDIRGNRIDMIFQDPMTSLNPTLSVVEQAIETIPRHRKASRAQARARAAELFELVRIPSADERLAPAPPEFFGGMRQRVLIAIRALA